MTTMHAIGTRINLHEQFGKFNAISEGAARRNYRVAQTYTGDVCGQVHKLTN